jgi:hypothetical protein
MDILFVVPKQEFKNPKELLLMTQGLMGLFWYIARRITGISKKWF